MASFTFRHYTRQLPRVLEIQSKCMQRHFQTRALQLQEDKTVHQDEKRQEAVKKIAQQDKEEDARRRKFLKETDVLMEKFEREPENVSKEEMTKIRMRMGYNFTQLSPEERHKIAASGMWEDVFLILLSVTATVTVGTLINYLLHYRGASKERFERLKDVMKTNFKAGYTMGLFFFVAMQWERFRYTKYMNATPMKKMISHMIFLLFGADKYLFALPHLMGFGMQLIMLDLFGLYIIYRFVMSLEILPDSVTDMMVSNHQRGYFSYIMPRLPEQLSILRRHREIRELQQEIAEMEEVVEEKQKEKQAKNDQL